MFNGSALSHTNTAVINMRPPAKIAKLDHAVDQKSFAKPTIDGPVYRCEYSPGQVCLDTHTATQREEQGRARGGGGGGMKERKVGEEKHGMRDMWSGGRRQSRGHYMYCSRCLRAIDTRAIVPGTHLNVKNVFCTFRYWGITC